jgi:hypothetical protein
MSHTLDAHSLVAAAILTAAVTIARAIRAAVKGQTSLEVADEVTNIMQLFLAILTELRPKPGPCKATRRRSQGTKRTC